MAALKTVAAAAAVALVGHVQATEIFLPPCLDPFQPFVYSGCFKEASGTQILPYRSPATPDDMTVEKCVAECKGNGYRYAGLVYYGVCYCGQTVNGQEADESECNTPCRGDESQMCGGNSIFSIYSDPTFPTDPVVIEDYDPVGCWTDDSNLGRALVYRQDQVDSATMTTEKCLKACRDGNFPFAGTEYGGECYCGVVIANDTRAAPADECNMPCNGNPDQTCGGPGRLNLYVADELQSLEPCGYEPPAESSSTTQDATSSTSAPSTEPTAPSTVVTPTSSEVVSTTTSSAVCVTTTVVPPECEYKLGKWCSSPLPDWQDVKSCKSAWSSCVLQVASCFKHAGWPDVLNCFDFGEWCADISKYCDKPGSGICRKSDFWGKKPPRGGSPPKTVTVTTTCPPTTPTEGPTSTEPAAPTTTSTTTKAPVPTPTNICKQPKGKDYPVGNIEMPVVTCNDLASDWPKWPIKQYNEADSRKCRKYERHQCAAACADACKEQYDECVDVYAEGCRRKGNGGRSVDGGDTKSYFEFAASHEKRFLLWGWNDSYNNAVKKCKAQYNDCVNVNRGLSCTGKCPKFGFW